MKSFFIALPVGGGRSRKLNDPPPMALRYRRCSSECEVPPLGIGIQAMQLSPYHAGLAGRHLQRLPVTPAFPTCSFPLRLSPSGQSDDPGAFLRAPPDCVRDSTPRSAAHTFASSGSPVALSFDWRWRGASRQFAFRIPPRSSHRVTYPPLPGVRLSRTRTTMGVPSPWGSRPEGDLRFLHNLTSEHGLGPPFIPTPGLDRPVSHRAGLRNPGKERVGTQ